MAIKRKRCQVFLEDDIITASVEQSKKFKDCRHSRGSLSWYARHSIIDRLDRDGININEMNLSQPRKYQE